MAHSEENSVGSDVPRVSVVHTRRYRVLLVDDERTLVEAGKRILQLLGYSAIGATSGREALRRIREEPTGIDILITDQSMPEMSGYELAGEVRKLVPGLPVILTTGAGSPQPELRALETSAILFKPFLTAELSAAIESLLPSRSLATQNQGGQ